ncbi:MAG: undecaprenyl/decaprenyl-phosphate alpha-N-acetylglucosaminyl 1-phosphate transferase [Bacilli bacterium]|nr:undecaprenyl/decaprenyl-phosphate alpha-N-acetylglucosaminyl 1-phosphate transferase [Bacilli bacterium]
MNLEVNSHKFYFILIVTFFISFILVPLARKIAFHVNAVDKPNHRRVNEVAMPTQGGLAIFVTFMIGFMLFADMNVQMISILIGGFILILTGFIDGINSIKASHKMLAQIGAAAVVVFYGKIFLSDISFLGLAFTIPSPLNYIFSIIFIVGIINAINLIDGLDGLCGGVSSIYFATIAIIAFILNRYGGLDIMLALIMLGSTLGFLFHNFPPASIYLGDTGSMFLGYMISVISLLGFKVTTLTSLVIPLVILAIPIFDTLLAIFRRILKGESIGKPDKEHFHHQLLKMKFSTRTTVLIIYAVNILFSVVSVLYVIGDPQYAILIYVLLMIMLLFLVLKTDILFEHKKNK